MDLLDRLIRFDLMDIVYIRYFAYFLEKVLDGEVLVVVVQTWFLRKKKEKKKIGFFPGERSNLGWDRSKAKANIISLVVTKLPKKFISIHIRVGTLLYFDIRG